MKDSHILLKPTLKGSLSGGFMESTLGKAFFGESMFYTMTDASKIALYHLVQKVKEYGFHFIDSQVETDHLLSLGAEDISRNEYLKLLKEAILTTPSKTGKWQ